MVNMKAESMVYGATICYGCGENAMVVLVITQEVEQIYDWLLDEVPKVPKVPMDIGDLESINQLGLWKLQGKKSRGFGYEMEHIW